MMQIVFSVLSWLYMLLLVAAAIFDIRTRRILPPLVYGMFGLAAVKTILVFIDSGMYLTGVWAASISCFLTTLVFYCMYRFAHGVGLGDVKLMAAAGLFYSIQGIFTIVLLSMLMTAAVGVVMVIKSRRNLKAELPFAPFVAAAAILREILLLLAGQST